jgi:hypothetical protein
MVIQPEPHELKLSPSLWLIRAASAPVYASFDATIQLGSAPQGSVVEAHVVKPGWGELAPGEAERFLIGGQDHAGTPVYMRVPDAAVSESKSVEAIGGRIRCKGKANGELWFARHVLREMLPKGPPTPPRTLVRAPPGERAEQLARPQQRPLLGLERALTQDAIDTLAEHGYVVIDDALPAETCAQLRAEMDALESHGQMWNSKSFSARGDAERASAPHEHICETQLDYKEVRAWAPTFVKIERDPTMLARLRSVRSLDRTVGQHVRIQINQGRGGCYTMHTDSGSDAGDGQALRLTALFYLNPHWKPGDGGELRIFPYPHKPEVIAPLEGRLVLFEPRMVHDVLPNYARRYCFTLWCYAGRGEASSKAGHGDHEAMLLEPAIAKTVQLAERWRASQGRPLPYPASAGVPAHIRSLFLPELRPWIVQTVYRQEQLRLILHSYAPGERRDRMEKAMSMHHQRLEKHNPPWFLELLQQLPELNEAKGLRPVVATASDACSPLVGAGDGDPAVRLTELQILLHRLACWWE